jgi:hypothetical protein
MVNKQDARAHLVDRVSQELAHRAGHDSDQQAEADRQRHALLAAFEASALRAERATFAELSRQASRDQPPLAT